MSNFSAMNGTAEDNCIALPRQAADTTAAVSSGRYPWLGHDKHDCMCKALHPNLGPQAWRSAVTNSGSNSQLLWAFPFEPSEACEIKKRRYLEMS